MTAEFARKVYETLQGQLVEEATVPGVENLFEVGKPCDRLYSDMTDAYDRIRRRLNVADEDADVEIMINSLLAITDILSVKMFAYGAYFAEHPEETDLSDRT